MPRMPPSDEPEKESVAAASKLPSAIPAAACTQWWAVPPRCWAEQIVTVTAAKDGIAKTVICSGHSPDARCSRLANPAINPVLIGH